MHTITNRHGVYFSGTISQLRAFLREAASSDILLATWIKNRLH